MRSWITPEVIAMKREAIESIYHHRMNVYDIQNVFNSDTGFMEEKEVKIYEDIPCRASTQLVEPTAERPREYGKKIRIHCAPELEIPIGARIELTFYNGVTQNFEFVSSSRNYSDHQVLLMRRYREGQSNYA